MRYEELTIEGRNAVLEAFRSGKTIDKVFVLEGCQDGPIKTIFAGGKNSRIVKLKLNFVQKTVLIICLKQRNIRGLSLMRQHTIMQLWRIFWQKLRKTESRHLSFC